jgi:hypothetical protein
MSLPKNLKLYFGHYRQAKPNNQINLTACVASAPRRQVIWGVSLLKNNCWHHAHESVSNCPGDSNCADPLSGAFAKKLVRGSTWQRSDFYLGVELSLASMASALVYVFDLAKVTNAATPGAPPVDNKIAATVSFLALCFFLLLWVLSTHQDWERRSQNPKGQFIWLGVITNLVGAGLLAAFVLLVKGV